MENATKHFLLWPTALTLDGSFILTGKKKKMTNFCRTAGDGEPGGRDETIVAIN